MNDEMNGQRPKWVVELSEPVLVPVFGSMGRLAGYSRARVLGPFDSRYAAKVAIKKAGVDGEIVVVKS